MTGNGAHYILHQMLDGQAKMFEQGRRRGRLAELVEPEDIPVESDIFTPEVCVAGLDRDAADAGRQIPQHFE